jgi:2-polyprenyl-6-methoxyphenol hydroxylase-like FAD-dependent oxidoreductase
MYSYEGERLGGPWDLIELGGIPPPIGRPEFQQFLYDQTVARGIPVTFGTRVVKYSENLDTNRAGVVTTSGEVLEADVVVAADGVGSRSWQITAGNEDHNKPRSSGYAVYRATFPTSIAHENPLVAKEFEVKDGRHDMRMYFGPDTHAITVTSNDTMTWLLTHKVGFQILSAEDL